MCIRDRLIMAPVCTAWSSVGEGRIGCLMWAVRHTRKAVWPLLSSAAHYYPQNVIPGTHFHQAESTWGLKNIPWWGPGIEPGTSRLVARCHTNWSTEQPIHGKNKWDLWRTQRDIVHKAIPLTMPHLRMGEMFGINNHIIKTWFSSYKSIII